MKILIIGGNRFFGKKLAKGLVSCGHQVTILNRGNADDGLGNKVLRLTCDRTDKAALSSVTKNLTWDIVYDQVCYDYLTAKDASQIFTGKTDRYIFTSSQSVYETGTNFKEEAFDPAKHKFDRAETYLSNYAEAKRQAEAGFARYAQFPVAMIRFPFVLGTDDYTKRLLFHVERVRDGREIYFPDISAHLSFVTSDFAAEVLSGLVDCPVSGALNVASPNPIKLSRFMELIEISVGKKALLSQIESKENHSPYGIDADWFMDCCKLKSLGYVASEIESWLPQLLGQLES